MNINRQAELEKIAEQLGIGKNREVECVSCKRKILFKDAIILTNKEKVSHICSECNEKLLDGGLTKKQIDGDEIIKQIEELRKIGQNPVPFSPPPDNYPWQQDNPWIYRDGQTWTNKPLDQNITYTVFSSTAKGSASNLLRLEPQYDN